MPRRPRLLLVADLVLAVVVVALAYWLLGSLLISGFPSDPDRVPPFVSQASLDPARAALAFGLPLALATLTLVRLRFPAQARWPWTWHAVAWLLVAFAESAFASPDFTAAVLMIGAAPAALIGGHQDWLRRASGGPIDGEPWSSLQRALVVIVVLAVVGWFAVYMVTGVLGMGDVLGPFPPFIPRAPLGPGSGIG